MKPKGYDVILDLGAAGDYYGEQPFFEDNYKYKDNVIGVNVNINELTSLNKKYKEIPLVLGDGCYLPFKDKAIDILFSNAVLEHAGDKKRQKKFAHEVMRVAKKWFVTTPNFWFPIETHWKLPFIHFLPRKTQKQIMDFGRKWFVENPSQFYIRLPRTLQSLLRRYFTRHGWYGQGYHLLNATNLKKLFPTSKIEKQRTTIYPEVLIAHSPATNELKKKILMVGPLPPTVGGITTFITSILESNLNKKYEFVTFTSSRPPLRGKIPSLQDHSIIFRVSLLDLFRSVSATLYHLCVFPITLLKVRPSIVHIHTSSYWTFWENSLYVMISKTFKRKAILHIHGSMFDKFCKGQTSLMKNLIRSIINMTDKTIALSLYWKRFLTDEMRVKDPDKVIIINNGVDSSKYMSRCSRVRECKREIGVLFIGGAYSKRKGIYDLVNAIPHVLEKFSNITFTIIGKGELENIKVLCKNLRIEQHVKILGEASEEEKIEQLCSSDIFVLPTYSEGMPIALLEAMAAGLPLVSTPVGAIPEVIDDGKNGFLIELGNCKALAEKIVVLAQNENIRREMGRYNQQKIMNQYDMSAIARKLSHVYSQLLENTSINP